jgi:hypothetical protein
VVGSGQIFVYNLPAFGATNPITGAPLPNDPRYVGPVDATFDVHANVGGGGSHLAAAFGLVMTMSGTGEVTYNVPDIDFGQDPPPNNVFYSASTDYTQQTGFDLMFGNMDVQSGGSSNQELELLGAHGTALANITVNDGDGLANVPIRVQSGVTGTFTMTYSASNTYTGFVDSDLVVHTDATIFPHTGGTIGVRESRPGDMNGDGGVDGEDIDLFFQAFADLDTFQATYPYLHALYIADFNADGAVDGEDIDPFFVAFAGGSPGASAGPTAVPEPSSVALAVMGAAGLGIARWRRRRK